MRLFKIIFFLFLSLNVQAQDYCFSFTALAIDLANEKFPSELRILIKDETLGADYMSAWNYLRRGGFDFETRTSPNLIKQLQTDVANTKYNLQGIFESDPDEIIIWKALTDDPFNASEIIKETTDARWLRWKDRVFAKAIFGKGDQFNKHMYPRIRGDLEAEGIDLANAVQVNELHVLPKKINGSYGKKVILDNAFIEKIANDFGDFEYYKVIYNDNKFGPNSPWTPNQKEEIIHFFRDNLNEKFIILEFRSQNYPNNAFDLKSGFEARLYREDIYKTLSNGVDDNPEFGEIINMNSNGFK